MSRDYTCDLPECPCCFTRYHWMFIARGGYQPRYRGRSDQVQSFGDRASDECILGLEQPHKLGDQTLGSSSNSSNDANCPQTDGLVLMVEHVSKMIHDQHGAVAFRHVEKDFRRSVADRLVFILKQWNNVAQR